MKTTDKEIDKFIYEYQQNGMLPSIAKIKILELIRLTSDDLKEAYSMGRLGKSIEEFNERFKNNLN